MTSRSKSRSKSLSKSLSKNGTAYSITGAQNAPVVVLIHGLGLNRHTWRDYLSPLAQKYRVLSYDLYGHGESEAPQKTPSLRLFAQQLCELLDELGIQRAGLIGFSLGGMINRRFAMDYPDRTALLGIFNSPHERGAAAQKSVEARAAASAAGGPEATIDASLERWFTASFRQTHADIVSEVRRWVLSNDKVIYAKCRQVLANGVIELIRPQPPITLPTLIITCQHDSGSTPEMAHGIAQEIKSATVEIIPELQHLGLIENPQLFLQPTLRFLNLATVWSN